MNKIALGAAQFGFDYGINNKRGRIPQGEVFRILEKALVCDIDTVDTAYAYGESERVLGNFMRLGPAKLKIISKLPKCEYADVERICNASLDNLGVSSLYGYLIHDFRSFQKDTRIWQKLEDLKGRGAVDKIGFSLYFPSELEFIFSSALKIDIIQVPFSIFDQRFSLYFAELHKRKIELYVRSVFLQGLVFKSPGELGGYFNPIKKSIEELSALSEKAEVPVFALCLNFALENEFIHKVIVGIDNLKNFNEIIQASKFLPRLSGFMPQLYSLRVDNEDIVVPANWNFKKANA